jgi:predicted NAD/FAD-binding protein
MLSDILRFNRESVSWLAITPDNRRSLRDFLSEGAYSSGFSPTGTCCRWPPPSGPARPARCSTCRSPPSSASARTTACCKSLTGPCGARSRAAVASTCRSLAARIDGSRLAGLPGDAQSPVKRWPARDPCRRQVSNVDQVVLACHSDQSLAILGFTASDAQREVLSAIRYQPNRAVLHTDRPCCRARESCGRHGITFPAPRTNPAARMRTAGRRLLPDQPLQPLPFETPVVVTLNPGTRARPGQGHRRVRLRPPDFRRPGHRCPATPALRRFQGENGIWLAGAWGSYGFHEDGLKSALRVAHAHGHPGPLAARGASQSAAGLA